MYKLNVVAVSRAYVRLKKHKTHSKPTNFTSLAACFPVILLVPTRSNSVPAITSIDRWNLFIRQRYRNQAMFTLTRSAGNTDRPDIIILTLTWTCACVQQMHVIYIWTIWYEFVVTLHINITNSKERSLKKKQYKTKINLIVVLVKINNQPIAFPLAHIHKHTHTTHSNRVTFVITVGEAFKEIKRRLQQRVNLSKISLYN